MRLCESGAGGPMNHQHHFTRTVVALLLAGVAAPVQAAAAAAAQSSTNQSQQDIIINAPPLFRDIQPERELGQDAIDSYGVSSVDELLGNIAVELGPDADQPLILVNGRRINDLSEIGAFPIEVVRSIEVLPRGSAVRAGGRAGQRVISITLKPKSRTATLTAAHNIATDGNWNGDRGEAMLTNVKGNVRANLSLRVRDEDSLLESQRDILQPTPSQPFALTGNVVAASGSGEIDPLLSALAGQIVTVTPVPPATAPTLASFVANANNPAVTDLGQFRTLRPHTRSYELNGSFAAPLTPWLNSSSTIRLSRNHSNSLRGLPNAIFLLAATNRASPFSRNVGLAFYGMNPLRYRSDHDGIDVNETLDATFGDWSANFNARHSGSKDVSNVDRQTSSSIALGDTVNPFTASPAGLIPLVQDLTIARNTYNLGQLVFNGPAGKLPAGTIQATVEGRLAWSQLNWKSTLRPLSNGKFHRNEQSIRGALDVPITSRANNFIPQLGDLSADGEYTLVHYSDAGSLKHYELGLTWEPIPALRFNAGIDRTDLAPTIQLLNDPVIETPGARVFDPLTGQTVDVTQITGGNPGLKPETTTVRRLTGLLRLVPKLSLQLNAEYTDTHRRNSISALPDASAAVMLAFPDRYIRDSNGVLTTVDFRPVNFQSERDKRLRWGFSMNRRIGGTSPGAPGEPVSRAPTHPPTYFQLTANHTMIFSDKILIRRGLDPVNLLSGGAIGVAGGRIRHQVDGTAALTSGGTGARVGITWRGASSLLTQFNGTSDTLRFSPLLLINLRAFTDVSRFVPRSNWARGLRLSLDMINVTNDRQRVRTSHGDTPLQYQPDYRDPLGRTIEIELRKVF